MQCVFAEILRRTIKKLTRQVCRTNRTRENGKVLPHTSCRKIATPLCARNNVLWKFASELQRTHVKIVRTVVIIIIIIVIVAIIARAAKCVATMRSDIIYYKPRTNLFRIFSRPHRATFPRSRLAEEIKKPSARRTKNGAKKKY